MLVLSRKANESIVIGNDITITVVQVSGNRVRLAIDAPPHVRILRGELELEDSGHLCAEHRRETSLVG